MDNHIALLKKVANGFGISNITLNNIIAITVKVNADNRCALLLVITHEGVANKPISPRNKNLIDDVLIQRNLSIQSDDGS